MMLEPLDRQDESLVRQEEPPQEFDCPARELGEPLPEFVLESMDSDAFLARCFQEVPVCVDELDQKIDKGEIVDPSSHHTKLDVDDDSTVSSDFSADSFASFTVTRDDEVDAAVPVSPPRERNSSLPEKRNTFVRFATHADGEIVITVDSYPSMTSAERRQSWYRPRDFRKFRRQAARKAESAQQSSYYKNYLKTTRACECTHMYQRVTDQHKKLLSCSKYRGYENTIFDDKNANRKATVQKILEFESQWKSCELMTDEERVEELSLFCIEMSIVSCRMARLVGEGDALVVAGASLSNDNHNNGATIPDPEHEPQASGSDVLQMVEI